MIEGRLNFLENRNFGGEKNLEDSSVESHVSCEFTWLLRERGNECRAEDGRTLLTNEFQWISHKIWSFKVDQVKCSKILKGERRTNLWAFYFKSVDLWFPKYVYQFLISISMRPVASKKTPVIRVVDQPRPNYAIPASKKIKEIIHASFTLPETNSKRPWKYAKTQKKRIIFQPKPFSRAKMVSFRECTCSL